MLIIIEPSVRIRVHLRGELIARGINTLAVACSTRALIEMRQHGARILMVALDIPEFRDDRTLLPAFVGKVRETCTGILIIGMSMTYDESITRNMGLDMFIPKESVVDQLDLIVTLASG